MRAFRPLLLAIALLAGGNALAGGRGFCRTEFGGGAASFSLRCAVEETVLQLGPLEALAGASFRYERLEVSVTAYTAFILALPAWWVEVDFAAGALGAFSAAIAGGVRW